MFSPAKYRAEKRARGECYGCSNPAEVGRTRCRACLDKSVIDNKRRAKIHLDAGLCYCGRERDSWQLACKDCRTSYTKYRKKVRTPHKTKEMSLKYKYGLTLDDFNVMAEQQGNVCQICGNLRGRDSLCVDHDHDTGAVRGLLCVNCNSGLGHFEDKIDWLESAINYLKKSREEVS